MMQDVYNSQGNDVEAVQDFVSGRAFDVDVSGRFVVLTLQPDQAVDATVVLPIEVAADLVDQLQAAIDGALIGSSGGCGIPGCEASVCNS